VVLTNLDSALDVCLLNVVDADYSASVFVRLFRQRWTSRNQLCCCLYTLGPMLIQVKIRTLRGQRCCTVRRWGMSIPLGLTTREDIKTCQANGKKILLSLGGAAGSYGFTSDSQAETFADELWNLFGGGTSSTRPFDDAIIDGFDLDIEGGSSTGYTAFITRMRTHYTADTSKSYYISTAPQCPIPDAYLNTVLTTTHVDFIFVQFYNNYCIFFEGVDGRWD